MPKYIDRDTILAEIERLLKHIPPYPTLAEGYAYKNGFQCDFPEKVDITDEIFELFLEKLKEKKS